MAIPLNGIKSQYYFLIRASSAEMSSSFFAEANQVWLTGSVCQPESNSPEQTADSVGGLL